MTTKDPSEPTAPAKAKSTSKTTIRNPRRLLILSPSSQSLALIPSLLKTLTGHEANLPAQAQSFAGYTTHPPLKIENRYYTAEVPIWVDEIPISRPDTAALEGESKDSSPQARTEINSSPPAELGNGAGAGAGTGEEPSGQWAREFSSAEARVVRDAIGAVMIVVENPRVKNITGLSSTEDVESRDDVCALKAFIRAVGDVRTLIEEERGEIGAVLGLLVLGGKKDVKQERKQKSGASEGGDDLGADLDGGIDDEPFSVGWWEDQLCEMGLIGAEAVEWDDTQAQESEETNQYGELQGMRRIKEVLETHEWAADEEPEAGLPEDADDLERELLSLDNEGGFSMEVNELEREMVGLRFAIERGGKDDEDEAGDEEIRVDAVEALLTRMRAIKDMSDELPEKDRKRFAAKAVSDIMKEI
ncbi:hypothetical protein BJY04DRAFT_213069 [Aspergillus karnatakaensis]|uniref:adaptin-binding domain-containing protein n=1 Tax=Aspergillus karnatakaensis TaxID=1810916 RepID=UPI003CCCC169